MVISLVTVICLPQKMFLVLGTLTTDMYELLCWHIPLKLSLFFYKWNLWSSTITAVSVISHCILFNNAVSNAEDHIKLCKWMASFSEFEGLGRRQSWPISR
jgi:hypothetical protein